MKRDHRSQLSILPCFINNILIQANNTECKLEYYNLINACSLPLEHLEHVYNLIALVVKAKFPIGVLLKIQEFDFS